MFFSSNYKSCLITIGIDTVAVFMPFPDVFKIFDSHSRDLYGMSCASGYCVLTSVEGVQSLNTFSLHLAFKVKMFASHLN